MLHHRLARKCLLLALLCAAGIVIYGGAAAGERTVNPYSGFDNDAASMLDAINRDHPTHRDSPLPPRSPYASNEINPYNSRKYRYDAPAMIDAINRDYPPQYPSNPPPQPMRDHGRREINPYEYDKYKYDSTSLIDAINRDHPRTHRGPSGNWR